MLNCPRKVFLMYLILGWDMSGHDLDRLCWYLLQWRGQKGRQVAVQPRWLALYSAGLSVPREEGRRKQFIQKHYTAATWRSVAHETCGEQLQAVSTPKTALLIDWLICTLTSFFVLIKKKKNSIFKTYSITNYSNLQYYIKYLQ